MLSLMGLESSPTSVYAGTASVQSTSRHLRWRSSTESTRALYRLVAQNASTSAIARGGFAPAASFR